VEAPELDLRGVSAETGEALRSNRARARTAVVEALAVERVAERERLPAVALLRDPAARETLDSEQAPQKGRASVAVRALSVHSRAMTGA
jgi:hypothetical protein